MKQANCSKREASSDLSTRTVLCEHIPVLFDGFSMPKATKFGGPIALFIFSIFFSIQDFHHLRVERPSPTKEPYALNISLCSKVAPAQIAPISTAQRIKSTCFCKVQVPGPQQLSVQQIQYPMTALRSCH